MNSSKLFTFLPSFPRIISVFSRITSNRDYCSSFHNLSIYVFGWKNGEERGKKEEEAKEKEKSFDSERVIYARLDARVDRDQASGLSRKRYSQGGSSGKIF